MQLIYQLAVAALGWWGGGVAVKKFIGPAKCSELRGDPKRPIWPNLRTVEQCSALRKDTLVQQDERLRDLQNGRYYGEQLCGDLQVSA